VVHSWLGHIMRGMKVGEVICRTTPNMSDETSHTGYDMFAYFVANLPFSSWYYG